MKRDVVSRFCEIARAHPEHAAVVTTERGTCTYSALLRFAATVRARVLEHSPKGGSIAIVAEQNELGYGAMLGALMAGRGYVPINPGHPPLLKKEIIEISESSVVLAKGAGANLTSDKCIALDLERIWEEVDTTAELVDEVDLDFDESIGYTIFTSGSTGRPKGVQIFRHSLNCYVDWAVDAMKISTADRWSQHPNLGFDLSVLDVYGALCGGATLFPITSPADRLMPARLIKRERLTIWNSVPSVLDLLNRASQLNQDHLGSLRLATFCGEALYPRHLEWLFEANENLIVHNTYGPTEATVSCTLVTLTVSNFTQFCRDTVALGDPIVGMKLRLDGRGNGSQGEIWLAGDQLSKGYLKRDEETQKLFVEDKGERWYRTGDLAEEIDGQLYFLERLDNQVKVNGYRIELGAIAARVMKLTNLTAKVVLINGRLCCFVENRGEPLELENLTAQLQSCSESYAVPEVFHEIAAFPRNQNDKIDLKKLVEEYGD
tara:strand:+ start:93 stop:1565 length:1473 start_codon:yes stop_codon:yes gene_type:complete